MGKEEPDEFYSHVVASFIESAHLHERPEPAAGLALNSLSILVATIVAKCLDCS